MYAWRFYFVYAIFFLVAALLIARAVYLQVYERGFLQGEGKSRYLRDIPINANRGSVVDRNGEIFAMSAPAMSVWVDPRKLVANRKQLKHLAKYLNLDERRLKGRINKNSKQSFLYLKRQAAPAVAEKVAALKVEGLYFQKEYKRYYPSMDSAAHVVGFTNIDGKGIDGIEMLYNQWLQGERGEKRILKDARGKVVENVKFLKQAVPGKDIALSLDSRLQHLVYDGIKQAFKEHNAKSVSAVILSVKSGEILAMANYPSYNPNQRSGKVDGRYRNRAVTDEFEPGSTAKPFAVMAALENKVIEPGSIISTSPGYLRVGRKTIRDHRDYGSLDIAGILHHSSNVGVSKLAMKLDYHQLYDSYRRMGFGSDTGSFFPGEVFGQLNRLNKPHPIEQATLAYGYGMTTTTLQLARAYSVLANGGRLLPVSMYKLDQPPEAKQVVSPNVADTVLAMLEGVVKSETGGTGSRANVEGYRVAGKTGTVHKNKRGHYLDDQYISLFAGIIPASRPEFVMVVMVDDPNNGDYFGGAVAAPVFSYVMERAMRFLNIPPDNLEGIKNEIIGRDPLKMANLEAAL